MTLPCANHESICATDCHPLGARQSLRRSAQGWERPLVVPIAVDDTSSHCNRSSGAANAGQPRGVQPHRTGRPQGPAAEALRHPGGGHRRRHRSSTTHHQGGPPHAALSDIANPHEVSVRSASWRSRRCAGPDLRHSGCCYEVQPSLWWFQVKRSLRRTDPACSLCRCLFTVLVPEGRLSPCSSTRIQLQHVNLTS